MRWALLALWLGGCAAHLPPSLQPDAVVPYSTSDGWRGSLRHYQATGPAVLLVHGMGANHYNWDYRQDVSLADYLRDAGWDVWVIELRGDPGSVSPSRRAGRNIDFDDYVQHDLPAAVAVVRAQTGGAPLYWVGHSMGGMLLYAYLRDHGDDVAAGVTIGASGSFHQQGFSEKLLVRSRWMLPKRGKLPSRAFASLSRPLGMANPMFATVANKHNLDPATARGLARYALVDLPTPLVHELVGWLQAEALVERDGHTPWLAPSDTPLLLMGASRDHISAEANVRDTCSYYSDCSYVLLGRAGGMTVDYGHVDPMLGLTARSEVYPLVLHFLQDQASAR